MKPSFKSFLVENQINTPLTFDEAIKLAKKDFIQAIKDYSDETALWRGVPASHAKDFFLADPNAGIRVSSATKNFTNFHVSASTKWKKYPRRDKCIIAANRRGNATNYGDPYVLFPEDDAVFGICPTEDFWGSFKQTMSGNGFAGAMMLDSFNEQFAVFLSTMLDEQNEPHPSTPSEMKSLLRKVEGIMKDIGKEKCYEKISIRWKDLDFHNKLVTVYSRYVDSFFEHNEDFDTMFDVLFNPDDNGFKYGSVYEIPNASREVWTDSRCLLVASSELSDFMEIVL